MSSFFDPSLTGPKAPKPYEDVMRVLKEFSDDVEKVTQGKVTCAINPGFVTSLGQQWSITAHSTGKGIDHILFRAYVPPNGVPTRLDFYEEQMTECNTAAEVKHALMVFAGNAVTVQTLQSLAA